MKKLISNLFAVAHNSRPVLNSGKLNVVVMVFMTFSLQVISSFAVAEEKLYQMHKIEKHRIKSRFIDQEYEIHVQMPVSLKDGSERFPVLYKTDINAQLDSTLLTLEMQVNGAVPRFITVGIGYPQGHFLGGFNSRVRDLTPTETEFSLKLPIEGIEEVTTAKKTGGAPEFLRFIREQLMPFINERYNTIPDDTAYIGQNIGGLFGLYTLFNQPDTFRKYIIGSPSIWWDNKIVLQHAERYIKSGKPLNARVYMGAGLKEKAPGIILNVVTLEDMLNSADFPGLELKTEIFPQENGYDVMAILPSKGVQYVYGPGCIITADCSAKP